MKLQTCLIALLMLGACASPPPGTRMTADQLATLPNTTAKSIDGGWVVWNDAKGTSTVKWLVADQYNHPAGSTDTGTYRIDKSGLWCQRFQSINDGNEYCTTVYRDAGVYHSVTPWGITYDWSLESGNTAGLEDLASRGPQAFTNTPNAYHYLSLHDLHVLFGN